MSRPAPRRLGILFLCTANSARSQIAEALLTSKAGDRFRVGSAGTHPAPRVNEGALEVLRRHGIDWSDHHPKTTEAIQADDWDLVITVCDKAKEACPIFPGTPIYAHWGMPDPAEMTDPVARTKAFRDTFLTLNRRIDLLLSLPMERLERSVMESRIRAIGDQGRGEPGSS